MKTVRSVVAGTLSTLLVLQPVLAANAPLPTGEQVRHGNVTIRRSGSQMDVGQSGAYGIIDWSTFDVGAGHGVHFANGSGATLNRVTGFAPSAIDGTLSATGSLYLLNRNGVIIGSGGQVLTGGDFVGSTLDLSNADFLDGGDFTLFGDSEAEFTNLGQITSSGGDVFLTGYAVNNEGSISAPEGRVGLAAGTEIDVLTDVSWLSGAFAVRLGERGGDVTNEGRIEGLVAELRTHGGNIYALAGNNEGLIHATGVRNQGGKVFLVADEGLVQSSGIVRAEQDGDGGDIEIAAARVENYGGVQDVSGASGGSLSIEAGTVITDTALLAQGTTGSGGDIVVRAEDQLMMTAAGVARADGAVDGGRIALDGGAGQVVLSGELTATGAMRGGQVGVTGTTVSLLGATVLADGGPLGGTIRIGGGWQGGSAWPEWDALYDVLPSERTYVSETTLLTADAGLLGRGGEVVVWSDGITEFAGTILARGGIAGGDGGRVETSGLEGLGVAGTVDASARAAYGRDGAWLLDPRDIIIDEITDSVAEFQRLVGTPGGTPRPPGNSGAGFGIDLAIDGTTMVVGTDTGLVADRALYVFENGRIAARLTAGSSADASGDLSFDFGLNVATLGGYIAATSGAGGFITTSPFTFRSGALFVYRRGDGWQNGASNRIAALFNPDRTGSGGQRQGSFGAESENLAFRYDDDAGTALSLFVSDTGFDQGFTSTGFSSLFEQTGESNVGRLYRYFISGDSVSSNPSVALEGTQAFQGIGSHLDGGPNVVYTNSTTGGVLAMSRFGTIDVDVGAYDTLAGDDAGFAVKQNVFVQPVPGGPSQRAAGLEFRDVQIGAGGITVSDAISGTLFTPGLPGGADQMAYADGLVLLSDPDAEDGRTGVGSPGFVAAFAEPSAGWDSCTTLAFCTPFLSLPGATANAYSGAALAIGQDSFAIGSPAENIEPGSVRLYTRQPGAAWSTATPSVLKSADPDFVTGFGDSLALDGNTVAVGAPGAGDPARADNYGEVYVFEDGALAAILQPPSPTGIFPFFGEELALEGGVLAVSRIANSGDGGIDVFQRGAGWQNGVGNFVAGVDLFTVNPSINQRVQSLDLNAGSLATGLLSNTGSSVLVFEDAGSWQATLAATPVLLSDTAGSQLALDGDTLVVSSGGISIDGQPDAVRVFEQGAAGWSQAVETLLALPGGGSFVNDFGHDIDVSGDAIVVGTYAFNATVGAAYVYERVGTWADSADAVATLLVDTPSFGTGVEIDGDLVVVGSGNGTSTTVDRELHVFDRQGAWRDGDANLVAQLPLARGGAGSSNFALQGNRIVAQRHPVSTNAIEVVLFEGPFDLGARAGFAVDPSGTLNIAATSLANSLSLGTNITLQANRDIFVRSAVTVDNPAGDGGDLALEAGRSILVNAPITTDNGALTLIANHPDADPAIRGSGEGRVVLGTDASNAPALLTLGTGDLLIAGGDRFENRTGVTDPFRFDAANPGSWLVYSNSPDPTGALDLNNLGLDVSIVGRDFVQYGTTFDPNDPRSASLPAGNGFVYAVTPTVGVNVGNASITYGETPAPALTLGAITVGGAAVSVPSAYTVTAAQLFGISAADLPNLVETGLAGSVGISGAGFANAGTFAGGLTATARSTVTAGGVFGVDIATGAPGDLTVAQRQLTASGIDFDKVYDATAAASLAGATVTGLLTGDAASVDLGTVTAMFDDEFVGVGKTVTITGSPALSGGDAGNYRLDFPSLATGDIAALDLIVTGLTGVDRVYDTTTDAPFAGTAAIAPLALDADRVALGGTLTAQGTFADANVGTARAIDVTGFVLTGSHAVNYNLIQPQGLTADVTPATLLVQGLTGEDRTYDTTTAVTLNGTAAVAGLGGDEVAVTGTALGTFDDANVAADKGVNLAGLTLTGTAAGNYRIATGAAESGITASVTPADLFVTGFTADDRVYDATTTATLSGSAAVTPLGTDVVLLDASAVTAAFADRNAGTNKPVTVAGLTISGTDAGNYALVAPQGLSADITPADLQLNGVTAEDRVYDASEFATLAGTPTVTPFAMDLVSVAGFPDARFDDRNVGLDKPVTVTGYTLTGADAGNYTLLQPTGLTADVTPRPLSMLDFVVVSGASSDPALMPPPDPTQDPTMIPSLDGGMTTGPVPPPPTLAPGTDDTLVPTDFAVDDRVYDATTAVTFQGEAVVGGILLDDDVTIDDSALTLAFADKNAGVDRPIVVSGVILTGADAANYDASDLGLFATITPAQLDISGVTAADRVYDATTIADLSGGALAGLFAGDDVTLETAAAIGALEDRHVGVDKSVTASGYGISGVDAANYALFQPQGLSATITAATLNLVGFSGDKTYDGTTAAPLTATGLDAVFASDDVVADLAAITGSYADRNAGEDKPIALNGSVGLTGLDAGNYVLNQPANLTGTIDRRGITVIGLTIADKIYDGTVVGAISGTGTFGGAIDGDDLQIAVGQVDISFADASAGADKPVALSGITLSGADAGNYDAATPTGITGTILQRALTVTGLAAEDRVYDRTTVALLSGAGSLNNVVAGDDVLLDETLRAGAFADENVGIDKPVTVSGLALNGAAAANYRLVAPTDLTATVTPAEARLLGVSGVDRIYDATTDAPLTGIAALDFGALNGVLEENEDISLAGTLVGTFVDKDVSESKPITLSGVDLAGTDAANYLLVLPTDLLADISPFALEVAGVAAEDRVYDATTVASLSGTPVADFFAGDDVAIDGAPDARFDDRNVGTAKPVTVTGYALSGADAFNYTLAQPTGLAADVAIADLALTGIVADDRVYDGTTLAPLSGEILIAPLGSDDVTLDGRIAAGFETKNAGLDKPVLLSGLDIEGADAANYRLVLPNLVADVFQRPLTVTGLAGVDRIYDATTLASISGTGVLDDVVPGDAVDFDAAAITARFLDENAGQAKPIALNGQPLTGIDAANYSLTLPVDLTADVDPKPVSVVNASAVDRAYDGTVDVGVEGGAAAGLVEDDDVALATAAAAGTIPDRNVGEDKPVTVTGFALEGSDASNYLLSQPLGLLASISSRLLEIIGVEVTEKFFDGLTDASISGGRLDDVVPGDNVNLDTGNGEGAFLDPEVGDDKPVALSGFTISGDDAGNYAIVEVPLARGDILPQPGLVTDIIPPEVLRQDAAQQTARQRAALIEFATAQADARTLIDYEALADQVITGVAPPEIIDGILDTLPGERDAVTQAYVDTAVAARNAVDAYNNDSAGYRTTARALKGLEQRFNEAQRELVVERGLIADLAADVARTETAVAALEENLARIAEAKQDRADLLRRAAEADSVGRGAQGAGLRAMAAELQEMIDEEDGLRARLAETNAVLAEQRETLDGAEARIAALETETEALDTEIAETETIVNNYRRAVAAGKERAEAAKAELAEARAAGAAAYADLAENLEAQRAQKTEQLASVTALVESDLATRTAQRLADQDPVVIGAAAALDQAATAREELGQGLENALGPEGRALADRLAAPGASVAPGALRDELVNSVPALASLQQDTTALATQADQQRAAVERMFTFKMSQLEQRIADVAAAAGLSIDLSAVPSVDASGAPIPVEQRLALGVINAKLAQASTADAGQLGSAAAGYQNRLSQAVAQEFGITPEAALSDPSAALGVAGDRMPTDVQSAGELATDAAVARFRLSGVLKDAAMEEAAAQDPTGTLSAINSVEDAAIGAFADEYGMTPDEMVVAEIRRMGAERTEGAVDGVAAAQSGDLLGAASGLARATGNQTPVSQALVSIADGASPDEAFAALPAGAQTPAVLDALRGVASGESPEDVIASFQSASSGEGGANAEAARARRTAMAMQEAAMVQASEVDPTGGVAAAMSVQSAVDAEFAATFGGTPDELALQALEDPQAAATKLTELGSNLLASPDASFDAAGDLASTALNMGSAGAGQIMSVLESAPGPLGDIGSLGGSIVDGVSGLFGGGPSEAEQQAAQAAQLAAATRPIENQAILDYLQTVVQLANTKLQLAQGVENAKTSVAGYVLASKVETQRQQQFDATRGATVSAIGTIVQEGLQETQRSVQQDVDALGRDPETVRAQAQLWTGAGS